ncbi:CPBP family glutamic-type intramembrane protease [Croceibacter atlanticus]|uniref:CPBP family glutamic-type intramembrane protease n=1 Tax=Croceibacter atlanticus TaxID=313588 RepID=UPI0032B23C2B
MIYSKSYKLVELVLLFVLLPLSFLLDYDFKVKAGLVILGFIYILTILFKFTDASFKIKSSLNWSKFFKVTAIKFIVITLITTCYVLYIDSSLLFYVPLNNPKLFVVILGVYTFLSVWPQEIIYRSFFCKRYQDLCSSKIVFMVLNAVIFSLAHVFLKNILVLILTFIGGLLFIYTYTKTKSTTLVSIEHALYGNWLFTVGMGQMLAFPGMEA